MAYDKQKAHEYYENYTKKGKKKGRKKSTKKDTKSKSKGKTQKLVGLSVSGLNDEGKMEFALMKEDLTEKMNEALKSAGSDEEKKAIRKQYQQQALQELQKIKANPSFQKEKKKSTKKSSKKSSSSSASSDDETIYFFNSDGTSSTATVKGSGSSQSIKAQAVDDIKSEISDLSAKISSLSDSDKEKVKYAITQILEKLDGLR